MKFEFESGLSDIRVGHDERYMRNAYTFGMLFENGAKIQCPIEYSKITGNEAGMICLHELEGNVHVIINFLGREPKPEPKRSEVHHGIPELQPKAAKRSKVMVKGFRCN